LITGLGSMSCKPPALSPDSCVLSTQNASPHVFIVPHVSRLAHLVHKRSGLTFCVPDPPTGQFLSSWATPSSPKSSLPLKVRRLRPAPWVRLSFGSCLQVLVSGCGFALLKETSPDRSLCCGEAATRRFWSSTPSGLWMCVAVLLRTRSLRSSMRT
jgi:hypothetical protein